MDLTYAPKEEPWEQFLLHSTYKPNVKPEGLILASDLSL